MRGEACALSLNFFARPPDVSRPPGDDRALDSMFRSGEKDGGFALLDAGWTVIDGCAAARALIKFFTDAGGVMYSGSLIIPFATCSWVAKFQAAEVGVTGIREAFALDRHLADGGSLEEWGIDTSAPLISPGEKVPPRPNPADAIEWDAQFPDHPLSRVRRGLSDLQTITVITDEAKRLPAFS